MTNDDGAAAFERLRKDAKRWLRAIRDGEREAIDRLERALPKHSERVGLREVQQAIARERGFASWALLKEETIAPKDLVAELLEKACVFSNADAPDFPERWKRAERIRTRNPEIATASIHTAVVCGELEHVKRTLAHVREPGGPQRWEPLLFLCYNRLSSPHAVEIARVLLDAGADPNTSFVLSGQGWACRFNALTGVMGEGEMGQPPHPQSRELARLLLDRGAKANDSQGLYNTHLVGDNTEWLELLFSYGLGKDDIVNWDPTGNERELMLSYLVSQAARNGHVARVRCLLAHGADANAKSRYDGKSAYRSAMVAGHLEIAELLRAHGARPEELDGKDAFTAACAAGDRERAAALLDGHREYLDDIQVMLDAAAAPNMRTLALVLELGMDPNRTGKHGHRPLHQGCTHREVAELLRSHGADPRARCFGGTATSWALRAGDVAMARFHAEASRLLIDAVASGHVELARELLRDDPACIAERTPSGDTALHRVPENQELIDLLFAHGAELGALNDAGQTPIAKLEADGHDEIADLLDAK